VAIPPAPTSSEGVEHYAARKSWKLPWLAKLSKKGDKAGVFGLASRGAVDFLEAGTTVHAFSQEGELTTVSVMSGGNLGKQCWIPTKLLDNESEVAEH